MGSIVLSEGRQNEGMNSILARHTASLANYEAGFRSALERLERDQTVSRLWKKDFTLWRSEPEREANIVNSLGWLTVAEAMQPHLADLDAFAQEVKNAGFEFAVVLGMGGPSLCPEVLTRAFGKQEGYPQLYRSRLHRTDGNSPP